jgi:hypothetical protein
MKKYIVLATILIAPSLFGAVEFDLRKGVDMTATNYVTQSLLNQLVDAGTISSTNKGAIIRRTGNGGSYWPDITLNPRYTNFLWLDTFVSPGTLKSYVCCGDAYTNWVNATVAPQSVTTAQLADWSVTDTKLATNSVSDFALKASSVSGNKLADLGIIAGKMAPSSVIQGNIAPGAIVGGQITNNTITYTNIAIGGISRDNLASSIIDNTKITNGGITTANIALTNIDATLLRNDAVVTAAITNGAVTTNKLAGDINRGLLNTNVSYGVARAFAHIDSGGTLVKGFNIASSSRRDTGDYRIVFGSGFIPTSTNYMVCIAALRNGAGVGSCYYSNEIGNVSVNLQLVGAADTDLPFTITIFDF